MKTDVVKPKDVFYNPTRLVVPLFQRPYVWSKETQWAPLGEVRTVRWSSCAHSKASRIVRLLVHP